MSEIELILQAFTEDVAAARSSRFLFRTIGVLGSESPEILSAINRSPRVAYDTPLTTDNNVRRDWVSVRP